MGLPGERGTQEMNLGSEEDASETLRKSEVQNREEIKSHMAERRLIEIG